MPFRFQVSLAQVKAWFANKRNRTLNTRPKRQRQMAMTQLGTPAVNNMLMEPPGGSVRNYNRLMSEVSHLVADRTQQVRNSSLQLVPGAVVPCTIVNTMQYIPQEVQ